MARPPAGLKALVARFDPAVLDLPAGETRLRLVVSGEGAWDVQAGRSGARLVPAQKADGIPTLAADARTWEEIVANGRAGMLAFREERLIIRHNLNLGVGFLAATSGDTDPGRLRFHRVDTGSGQISVMEAGTGDPVILVHGLGATKGSFIPTILGLSRKYRMIALDLPGFGDSTKPLLARYHPPFFARAVVDLMAALGLEKTFVIGNSMGGRTALEVGLRYPGKVRKLVLLAPSLAWKRKRPLASLVRLLRPELSLAQLAPRAVVEGFVHRLIPGTDNNWVRAGVDEFLRAYMTPRGRLAFYSAARQIYLEEPHGAKGFWTRLAGLVPEALFIWGRRDTLVPIGFAKHVRRALPSASHVELDCGHVPQMERNLETNTAIADFFGDTSSAARRAGRKGEAPRATPPGRPVEPYAALTP